jgi:uncharacterized CHY-type Zn-finger protein
MSIEKFKLEQQEKKEDEKILICTKCKTEFEWDEYRKHYPTSNVCLNPECKVNGKITLKSNYEKDSEPKLITYENPKKENNHN